MKENIKKEWVQALRSGEIPQTTKVLGHDDGSRCCLGVLCDIAVKHGIIPKPQLSPDTGCNGLFNLFYGKEAEGSYLPEEVLEWAEIKNGPAYVSIPFRNKKKAGKLSSLASANDGGFSFDEIADKIETDCID